jgi:hypothetical protein
MRNHKIHKIHQKSAPRSTASVGRVHGKHGPHGKRQHVGRNHEILEILEKGLRKALPAWGSRGGVAAFLSVVPQGAMSPYIAHEEPPSPVASRDTPPHPYHMRGDTAPLRTTLILPPHIPREHQKSIRRMRSVQDSVLPEGRGGEASPHFSLIL